MRLSAEAVRAIWLETKLTQPELAAKLGVNKRTVRRWVKVGASELGSRALTRLVEDMRRKR